MIINRLLCRSSVCKYSRFNIHQPISRIMGTLSNGDLNNIGAARARSEIKIDSEYRDVSLAIPASEDDALVRQTYRPFLLEDGLEQDWIACLELSTVLKMVDSQVLKSGGERLKILVLHGSMRNR